jgi:hypothetical protein
MKNTKDNLLAKNQCQDTFTLNANQIIVVLILATLAVVMGTQGNLMLASCLGVLVFTVLIRHYINQKMYHKYSIHAISRFMAESQFPDNIQVQVNCRNKQRYVLLNTQKPTPMMVLIIDIINPELLDLHQTQQELQHYANHDIEVYMIINHQWEGAEMLKTQLTPYIGVYNIYNLLDNCLVHLKGKLERMASVSV